MTLGIGLAEAGRRFLITYICSDALCIAGAGSTLGESVVSELAFVTTTTCYVRLTPALPGVDIAVEVSTHDALLFAVAIFATDQLIESERSREADVTVGSSHPRRTNALSGFRFAQSTWALALFAVRKSPEAGLALRAGTANYVRLAPTLSSELGARETGRAVGVTVAPQSTVVVVRDQRVDGVTAEPGNGRIDVEAVAGAFADEFRRFVDVLDVKNCLSVVMNLGYD